VGYGLALFFAAVATIVEVVLFAVNGYSPFVIDFAAHYLMQTLIVFLFADMHWPLVGVAVGEDQQQLRESVQVDE
jgi:hypothetical protein